ncbi:Putative RNA methylase [Trachipleistophora hominis]|uniref:Putative RNA methylase n=1 Tax=Trachipleistophora hominis TaxID=72359 RepID=L7JVU9_TRAHO|nr:Putative RNA methylase [Trachipleistophora hominis]
MYTFLVRLVNTYQNFRFHEVLCLLRNYPHKIITKPQDMHPYMILETTFEAIREIGQKSIFVKQISYLLYVAETNHELLVVDETLKEKLQRKTEEFVKLYLTGELNRIQHNERVTTETAQKVKFKLVTETFGCKIKQKNDFSNKYCFLTSTELILRQPLTIIYVISCTLNKTYFSIHVMTSRRKEMLRYGVPNRLFIGHTAMDLEVSAFMFNITVSTGNCIILDPFVGSGSIILYCALMGCYVVGCDISKKQMIGQNTIEENNKKNLKSFDHDIKQMITSYSNKITSTVSSDEYYNVQDKLFLTKLPGVRTSLAGTSIHSNFYQFGVEERLLGIFRASIFSTHFKKVDHVITDLPYGIRASLQKETMISLIKGLRDLCDEVLHKNGRVCFSIIRGYGNEIARLFEAYELVLSVNQKLRTCERVFYLFQKI